MRPHPPTIFFSTMALAIALAMKEAVMQQAIAARRDEFGAS